MDVLTSILQMHWHNVIIIDENTCGHSETHPVESVLPLAIWQEWFCHFHCLPPIYRHDDMIYCTVKDTHTHKLFSLRIACKEIKMGHGIYVACLQVTLWLHPPPNKIISWKPGKWYTSSVCWMSLLCCYGFRWRAMDSDWERKTSSTESIPTFVWWREYTSVCLSKFVHSRYCLLIYKNDRNGKQKTEAKLPW